MLDRNRWATMLLAPTLMLLPLACGGGDRDVGETQAQDELERALDLALQGDTMPATFGDVPVAVEPESPPAEPVRPAAPRPTPPVTEPDPEPPVSPPEPTPPEPTPPEPRFVTRTAGIGTTMTLSLDQELSTETNQVGDPFTATVTVPVRDANGEIVIPIGATVRGRVTQVQKSGRVGETAVLNLAFEAVTFEDESHALIASVQQANPERRSRASTGEQVGKVAAGAAAGAILGRILGSNTKDAIKGGVIGAAAGTAIALGTADVDAVLPAGSEMIIRIDQPIAVTRQVG